MDYAKKYKWVLTGFIIMVVLNLVTLGSIWLMRPPLPPSGFEEPGSQRMLQQYMARELNLSDQQIQEFRELRRQHMEESRVLAQELNQSRLAYFRLFMQSDSSAPDKVKADSLAVLIGENYIKLETSVFNHFAELKSRLNEEQLDKFRELARQGLFRDHMGQRRGPGPGAGVGKRRQGN